MKQYNESFAQAVKQWLDSNEFKYDFNEELGHFFYSIGLNNSKLKELNYLIIIGENSMLSYAICTLKSTEDVLSKVGEFLHRANYNLRLGKFELDYNDGEIRYSLGMDCDGITPSESMIETLIALPVQMFSRYGDGLIAVMFDVETPKAALERVEAQSQTPIVTH